MATETRLERVRPTVAAVDSPASTTSDAAEPAGITPAATVIFAISAGIAVANVYYPQPVLELMSSDLHADARAVGLIAMMMQVGYAIGILVFVPLGDIVQRRGLIVGMFTLTAVFLAGVASAPTVGLIALAILLTGITTTAPQILLPFAADLALARNRGRIVGMVQTGVIMGTLAGRALGGLIGAHFGWRAVFVFASAVAALSTFALVRVLPLRAPNSTLRYFDLMRTLPGFVARYTPLRVSMGLGFISFSTFAGLWTVLAFHVRNLGFGADVVGYIGLVSLVGAIFATRIGALADRRGTLVTGTLGWFITLTSYVMYLVMGFTLWGVLIATTVMAMGTQITQISNQTRIFALDDFARSRINTIYMFTNFTGGAFGSFLAAWAWQEGGWTAMSAEQIAQLVLMSSVLLYYRHTKRKAAAAAV